MALIRIFQISDQWHNRLNEIAIAFAMLFIFGFIAQIYFSDTLTDVIDISPVVAGLSATVILYGFFGFRLLAQKSHVLIASLITFALFAVTIGLHIMYTGGYASPYLGLWVVVVILGGMFDWPMLALLFILTNAYYLLLQFNVIDNSLSLEQNILYVLTTELPFIASFIIWRQTGGKPQPSKSQSVDLANLLESEKTKANVLINSIADGVAVIDTDSRIQLFNPAAKTMTGWTSTDALNIDYKSVLKLTTEDDTPVDQTLDPIFNAFQKGEPTSSDQFVLHTRSDKKLFISISVSPLKSNDQVSAVVVIFRDVSQQKTEERRRAEFISTASHEMRTPVAAIEGYLSLAMNENVSKIDSKARTYLDKAHQSTRHLGQLFQDLLTAAKTEDGRLTSHPRVTDAGKFLEQLFEDMKFSAEKKGLRVEFDDTPGDTKAAGGQVVRPVFYTYVDPDRLREAITNLFDNAVKYTEEGKITIGFSGDDKSVLMTVKDTGAGIPQEDIPHLFEKFYRVDNTATRQIGGTGLGLFITRKIIELYNGRIWVESELGKGSKFFISIPRIDNSKASELMKKEDAKRSPLDPHTK